MGARGPKPLLPSDEDRAKIQIMTACGLTREEVAQVMGRSLSWLNKHCSEELVTGRATVKAKVGGSIISQAIKGNMTAAIFYAKTQMGWKERAVVEHEHYDLSSLSDEELDFLERIRGKVGSAPSTDRGDPGREDQTLN